jgi:iron complex outermembrane recepter protein
MSRPSSSTRRLPALALRAALAAVPAAALCCMAPVARAQTEATHRFDLAAGPLSTSLARAAAQAGVALSADASLTAGRSAARLQGVMTLREALGRLLAGSGLEAVPLSTGGYTLRPRPAAAREAAAPPQQQALPPVTVLGSREPNLPMSSVPSSITQVGQPTVLRDLTTSALIEDILARNVPGVHPSNVGSRTIRGRTAQVFINGAPMNEQLRFGSGSDLNTLSPDHLESIEVSRGANSAYGFGSPGGIIALGTPQARSTDLVLNTRVRASANTRHAGGSLQATVYQSAARIVGDMDYHVAFSATHDGTSRTPAGEVANIFSSPGLFKTGDENLYNADANLGYDLGAAGRLRLVATAQSINYIRSYGFEGGEYRVSHVTTTPVPGSGRSWRRAGTVNLSYENDDLLGSTLRVEMFASQVKTSRYELGDEWFKEKNAYAGMRSAITTPLNGLARGAALSYGLDAIRNEMDDPLYNSVTGQLAGRYAPQARLDMWAPYAQLKWPLGGMTLNGGVRYERYGGRVESTGRDTVEIGDDGPGGKIRGFGIALFNVGALQPLTPNVDLHATYTQGAEISQIRRAGFVAESPDRIAPQAARSHQYEIGLRRKGEGLTGSATAFYTQSRLISSTDCSVPTRPCTPLREPRKIWGLEFAGDAQLAPQWQLSGTLTWHDGRRKAEGSERWTPISSIDVAPIHGSMTLGYAPAAGHRHELILDWRGGRGRISDDWPDGQVEALRLVHLSSSVPVGPGTLEFGVHNLLNTTYYSIPAEAYNGGWVWLPEQGRRVSVGYRLKW